jgi:A/G-specific adenine glycosylase
MPREGDRLPLALRVYGIVVHLAGRASDLGGNQRQIVLNDSWMSRYNPNMGKNIAKDLLAWYDKKGRDLPWRKTRDPYRVWVSEIMLQQTRVETVIPYYERWMARFPAVKELAEASREDVLLMWEGLGYYRRAHNLHAGAQVVMEQYGGKLPDEVVELTRLPGIGRYTAAAIAAIAFNADTLALDGNLRRVIARLIDLEVEPRTPEGERALRRWGSERLPKGRASDFNQALMDLGATVCTPRGPACERCPLSTHCLAFKRDLQDQRPVRSEKRKIPQFHAAAGVIGRDGKVLIARRPEGKLLGGLWEFPGGRQEPGETLEECLMREMREELDIQVEVGPSLGTYAHAYTHFRIQVHAFACTLPHGDPTLLEHEALAWVVPSDLANYPMGKIDRAISDVILKDEEGYSL